jgi:geranylgeranyl reductase family protein
VTDVVIAGAGPAGIACAVALVRARSALKGRVVVLDRARFPRDKPCGGGLTGHMDEVLSALGLRLDVPRVDSQRAVIAFHGVAREVPLDRPVRMVQRTAFDASLVAQARALGIEVREGASVTGYEVKRDRVEVRTADGIVEGRVLVGADGAGSVVRRALLGRARTRPIRLFRLEIQGTSPFGQAMLYDFSPMTEGLRGYLWIFPAPGQRINVGLMHDPTQARSGADLEALLRRSLRRHGIEIDGTARGWPAWGYDPKAQIAAPRVIAVGDAAGIDALTGEGIAIGMEQATVAARAIVRALETGDLSFRGYRRALRVETVGRELAVDRWAARLLYGGERWRHWLPLVLFDEEVSDLYARRVSGSVVLADEKWALCRAVARHAVAYRARSTRLAALVRSSAAEATRR